ncbi:hypothetical protein AALO_G00135750 [Alosa alosa]|uniref:Uncharacterized protein n=1 Tax=Alosa alosa TaxID=278164 RepID=A0AAV6GM26_9TELE|nr:hypothetical protein AALO_G00135750 [Alosa alosa]
MSSVFKRGVSLKKEAHEVDVSTTPNPNNQTQTEAEGGASEDVQAGTPEPNSHNQTASTQPDVTESPDGPSEDAEIAQNQTTSAHSVGTDYPSEDAVLTTVMNLKNGTTAAQDGTTF